MDSSHCGRGEERGFLWTASSVCWGNVDGVSSDRPTSWRLPRWARRRDSHSKPRPGRRGALETQTVSARGPGFDTVHQADWAGQQESVRRTRGRRPTGGAPAVGDKEPTQGERGAYTSNTPGTSAVVEASALGLPYAVFSCMAPSGTWTHYSLCEHNGTVSVGTPGGTVTSGRGFGYGCALTNVVSPGRGYTSGKVGSPQAGPAVGWKYAPETRASVYGFPAPEPEMKGVKAPNPSPERRSLVIPKPWGTGPGSGAVSPGTRSYCDVRGLPSMVYLCNTDGALEVIHFCRDAVRGWWYDLFGNQMGDFGMAGYCHMVGVRVPDGRYRFNGGNGRNLPIRGSSVGIDYSHKHEEPLDLIFTTGSKNAWAPFPRVAVETLICFEGKVVLDSRSPPRYEALPMRGLDSCRGLSSLGTERIPDVDISNWETTCMPAGHPYVVLACWVGDHVKYASFCDGTSGERGVAWREGLGLFHECRPTNVRAPGRNWGQWPRGPATHGWGWFSYTGSREQVLGRPETDPGATGLRAGPRDVTAGRKKAIPPWGVGAGVRGDAWDGGSYCNSYGLPSLVYVCHSSDGIELLHFCRDAERGWWYDMHYNQMYDDGAAKLCHPVGIRVPPATYNPTRGGRRLAVRRMDYVADLAPRPAEHREHWMDVSGSNPWLKASAQARTFTCKGGVVVDTTTGGEPKRATGIVSQEPGTDREPTTSWADDRAVCQVGQVRMWGSSLRVIH
ncbi:hypothetical protein HRG_000628 [Hirsutella rhossiliensis]|uniref:Uncharacterized protein n=1 Tax=Hirsutella rhossiliensis TaxID=111463 RepID=A0A9P8SP98_9HYPO|nr:uncharacterized protein HRG_00628 [Hirsutella rhossiliensis]KAH0967986.1 hypothetical protein HRG_00628 [Hirsutella rhossiliensis]